MTKIKRQQTEAYLLGGGLVSFLQEYFRISNKMAEKLTEEIDTTEFREKKADYQIQNPHAGERAMTWEEVVAVREEAYKVIEHSPANEYGWDYHTRSIIKNGDGSFKTWKKIFTDMGYSGLVDKMSKQIHEAIDEAKYEDYSDILAESHFYRIKAAHRENSLDNYHIKTMLVFLVKITPVFPTKIRAKVQTQIEP